MSRQAGKHIVGPRYWMYMATVMATRIESAPGRKSIVILDIPRGVYRESLRFFEIILGIAGPEYFSARFHTNAIAAQVLKRSMTLNRSIAQFPKSIKALDARMWEFYDFLKGIDRARNLSGKDAKTASELQMFFRVLVAAGEMEGSNRFAGVPNMEIEYDTLIVSL